MRTNLTAFAGLAPLLLTAVTVASCTFDTADAQDAGAQGRSLREFGERTRAYLALRTKVAAGVAAVPGEATPEQITRHQEQLSDAVRAARRDARQGDVFTPPVVPQFRTIIRRDLQARDIRDALAAMQEVPLALPLRVNTPWPADAPRATVPAQLLSNLYPLPEGLEYRFLDRHLVLLDGEAGLVVDYILDVVPTVVRGRH